MFEQLFHPPITFTYVVNFEQSYQFPLRIRLMAVHLSYTIRILVAEPSIGCFVVEGILANATPFVVWVCILVENIDSQRFDTEIVSESVSN
jgi:uncharacterized membrane protein